MVGGWNHMSKFVCISSSHSSSESGGNAPPSCLPPQNIRRRRRRRRRTLGGAVSHLFFSLPVCLPSAVRSRDTSVRGQHGGHACGVSKQIASIVQLTPPREPSVPSAKPVWRRPNKEQNGWGQQTSVPVSARDQGGASGERAAACVSRYVCLAKLSYRLLHSHCPATKNMCPAAKGVWVFGAMAD